ncbi:sugar phosphate nucleotidyltransferase [Desulfuromonas sp. CSMB_57]|jgi:glucose-1-phosphate thymidylyltransferase|uniref:sugar phosphate nucleotidyltransferase n=1 Tax=Desulfuromonas sp. CSMB_57 TaxID=2807629 RepID=UPI001CD75A62|nr:sugar phosphate nucleotidyltransferase [Desulfuromonas sp. CSMB_57]
MKIILPVAGKGTRLRPHTHTRAKSLVQVAGKTVLEHIIERLKVLAADELIFITDDNGEQIERFMQRCFPDLRCSYIVQHERLGPAHAVSLAAPRIEPGDDVLVVFNDTIFVTDLTRIPELVAGCDGLIYSKEVEDYQRFGVNVVQDGFIVDMVEKPDTPISRLAQVGLYYLKDAKGFMKYLEQTINAGETVKGEFYLPAVFMRMVGEGFCFRAPEIDAWLDCGKPETLLETNRFLLKERHLCRGELIDTVVLPPVHIAEGVTVRSCIIGPNVSVAPGTVIENCIVSDSIINADCQLRAMNLRDSILGQAVRLTGTPRRMNVGDHSLIEMEG